MTIMVGDPIPEASLQTPTPDGPKTVSTRELFTGNRVVLFAVPGAFTPTCSDAHLPSFLTRADEILSRGVDTIACLAVNDVFVVGAWGKDRGVGDRILMLADGNGELTRAMGLELDVSRFGMGVRSRRYAAVVDDGILRLLNVESGPGVGDSGADAVLAALDEGAI